MKSQIVLFLFVHVFGLLSCGEESEGGGGTAAPEFGADQVIASREVSLIDAISAKKIVRDLEELYAPEVSSSKQSENTGGDSDCNMNVDIKSSEPDAIDVEIKATQADCPDLVKGSSQLSEYELQISSLFGVKCIGADFSSLVGRKKMSELSNLDFSDYGCDMQKSKIGTRLRMYFRLKLAAKDSSGKVVILSESDSEESNKGAHCFEMKEAKVKTLSTCKSVAWAKTYWGDETNINKPYDPDPALSGPRMIRTEVILTGATYTDNDLFFQTGSARVGVNAWNGNIDYLGAFQQPEVKLKSGGEDIVFKMPMQRPRESDTGLSLVPHFKKRIEKMTKVIF